MRPLAERPEDVPHVFADRFNSGDPAAVAEVYRRGPDDRWRYTVDNPFGTAATGGQPA